MSEITDAQILQALKEKARLYTRLAAELEKELGPVALPRKVTLEAVQDYLRQKGGRPGDLAKYFGVPETAIKEIVNQANSGIQTVERGWLKLEESFSPV